MKRLNKNEIELLAKMRNLRDLNYPWDQVAEKCKMHSKQAAMNKFSSLVMREAETIRRAKALQENAKTQEAAI